MGLGNLLTELRRRRVWLVGGVYIVSAWIVAQVASLALPTFSAPSWVMPVLLIILGLGLPLAIILAWAQETQAPSGEVSADTKETTPESGPGATLAVLPFDNLSGDAEQEHLADGMTEDIITRASRLPGLAVVARNSSFAYKGQNPDIRKVGRELNARYVLEGSLRKMGDRVRITAQLIEAASGTHLWSESYDRSLDNIFALQDEVVDAIADALGILTREAEIDRARTLSIDSLDDRTLVSRLRTYPGALMQGEDTAEYEPLLELALERADRHPELLALTALCSAIELLMMESEEEVAVLQAKSRTMARDAVRRAPNDASVLYFAGAAAGAGVAQIGEAEEAVNFLERSLELSPNNALTALALAGARIHSGQWAQGVKETKEAMARDRHAVPGIGLGMAWSAKAAGEAALGNYDVAINDLQEALRAVKEPGYRGWALAGYYDLAGRGDEALAAARDAHLRWPKLKRELAERQIVTLLPEPLHASLLATIDRRWDASA